MTGATFREVHAGIAAPFHERPNPLTDEEVRELDGYGRLTAFTPLTPRAMDLWQREIFWGRVNQPASVFDGVLSGECP